jgi:hypothetical protein
MTARCPACGAPNSKRSLPDHRRLFGIISNAYANWPESHEFQPDSADHLRAWLLCKAGYRKTTTIPIEHDHPAIIRLASLAAEGAIHAAGTYAFVRPHGHAIAVISAKSMRFDKLDRKGFVALRDALEDVIEAESGLSIKDLEQDAA